MTWQQHSLGPVEPPVSRPAARYASPAPMRFLAATGFFVAGILTWQLGTRLLGMPSDVWRQSAWDGRITTIAILSVILAILGGLAGAAIGLTIPVRSARANFILTVLWQYCANGSLLWVFMVSLVLQKVLDDAALQRMKDDPAAVRLFVSTIAIGTGGALAIAAMLVALGLLGENRKAKLLLCLLVAAVTANGMVRLQAAVTPPVERFRLFLTFVFPLALVFFASSFIARDLQSRRQVQGDR